MIGDDIEITIVDIRGDKVRLGVGAPKAVSVHRKEVYDAIRRESVSARATHDDVLSAKDMEQLKEVLDPASPVGKSKGLSRPVPTVDASCIADAAALAPSNVDAPTQKGADDGRA